MERRTPSSTWESKIISKRLHGSLKKTLDSYQGMPSPEGVPKRHVFNNAFRRWPSISDEMNAG